MPFNSVPFVACFAAALAAYRVLPHRGQNWLLLAASYAFYASWDWRFLGLLLVCTAVAYGGALLLGRLGDGRARTGVFAAAVGTLLALLGFFKYFGFFAANLRALVAQVGWQLDGPTLAVLLPVGISFYTFVAIGYLADVYRRRSEPCGNAIDVAVFIGFFPTLLAGPIERASTLLRQIRAPRSPGAAQAAEGLWLVLWGFFKKTYVADNLGHVVDQVFRGGADGPTIALGVVAFAFQLYGDFSGYSDIARGMAKLLGIELTVNFRFPYFVRTPQEFWTHWHVSLSEWLRDYLFLPLGFVFSRKLDGVRWLGLRDDFWIYAAATLVTMALAGLWHGAAWTFVLWGVYQGVLLVVFRLAALLRPRRRRHRALGGWVFRWRDAPGALGMFALTCYGWLLFRAESLGQAVGLTGGLFTLPASSWAGAANVGTRLAVYAGPLLVLHLAEAVRGDLHAIPRWPPVLRYSVYVALLYTIALFSDFRGSEFLYFQF